MATEYRANRRVPTSGLMGNLDGLEHVLKIVLCRCTDRHAWLFLENQDALAFNRDRFVQKVSQLQLYGYLLRREKAVGCVQ